MLARLWGSRDGSGATEFAILAPILCLFLIGILEVGLLLFGTVALEGAVREASRFGLTGYAPAGVSRETALRQVVERHSYGLIESDQLTISYLVYQAFDQVGQPEPFTDSAPGNGQYDPGETFVDVNGNGHWDADMGVAGIGGPGDVVLYTLQYDWPLMTGLLAAFIGHDGRVPIRASIAVRNEPYNVAGGGS